MNSVSKLPGVIIVVAVIAIIYCFNSMKTVEEELVTAESNKAVLDKQLERYADIDRHYGRASDDFYADKPIVILRGKGATEIIRVYRANESPLTATMDLENIEAAWQEQDDRHWIHLSITPKISSGYKVITFTNDKSEEEFTVLVIVK